MSKNEAQRSSNKRSIIRMAQTTNRFTNDTPLAELETALDILEDYWTQFQTAQVAIEATCGPQAIDQEVIQMEDTESSFMSTKSKWKGFLKRYSDIQHQQGAQGAGDQQGAQGVGGQQGAQGAGGQQGGGNQVIPQNINSRLPKLEVPQFNGAYTEWTTFKDLFKSMVTDQPGLTNAVKLHYLKTSTLEEAKDIVSEYKTMDVNFQLAWNALEERFENRRMIITSHLKILFEQPTLTTESATSLRMLLRTTQKNLRSLKSLGGPTEHWDWLLIYMIVIRLDSETRRYWELKHTTKEMATLEELITALEHRCNALETEHPLFAFFGSCMESQLQSYRQSRGTGC